MPVYPGWSHDEIQRAIRRGIEPAYMGTFLDSAISPTVSRQPRAR